MGRDSQALSFGALQVQTYPFAIDQHEALIDELLTGAVISFVAEEGGRRKNELDRCATCSRSRKPYACTEINAIEIGPGLERCENRPDQMGDVFIERECGNSILRAGHALPERGRD